MKSLLPFASLSLLFPLTAAFGQAPVPRSGGNSAPQQTQTSISPGVNFFESDTAQAFSKDVFDVESDSIDFEEGTLNWKGRTFNIGDQRAFRARFERYLATPELTEDQQAYLALIQEILDNLSLVGDSGAKTAEELNDQMYAAWEMLFQAGRYEMDAGTSLVVANHVYNVWRVRDEFKNLQKAQRTLEQERDRIRRDIESTDWYVEREHADNVRNQRIQGDDDAKESQNTLETKKESANSFRTEDLAANQARLLAIQSTGAASGIQAKLQFQSHLVSLLMQRRYDHCLISCHFYRYVFKGSHTDLQVGTEQMEQFLPISDFSPTVDTIEMLAREAKADVSTGMRTVESLYANRELKGALERLQETFLLGEHSPSVLLFPGTAKRQIHSLYRKVREMENLADLKDFETLETVVADVQELALDFPSSSVLAAVRAAQRTSNLALMASQQALAVGELDKAEAALERATTIWPLNPAIKNFTDRMATSADKSAQATVLFDEVFERGDFRHIYDRRREFGGALLQDAARSEQLGDVIEKVGKMNLFIGQAEEMIAQNKAFTAWELLLAAEAIDPNDPVVARAKSALAGRVAIFVQALDTAQRAEENSQLAVSLNSFLAAQDIYPASQQARLGIERVSKQLLASLAVSDGDGAGM